MSSLIDTIKDLDWATYLFCLNDQINLEDLVMTYSDQAMSKGSGFAESNPGSSKLWSKRRSASAIAAVTLFLTGAAMPAAAQIKLTQTPLSEQTSVEDMGGQLLTDVEIQQIMDDVIAEETSGWSAEEKAVMKAVMALEIDDASLLKLMELSEDEILQAVKSNPKLAPLKAMEFSDAALEKAFPAFAIRWLWTVLGNISKAVTIDVIRELVRVSASDFSSIFSAMRRGDMTSLRRILATSFPRNQTFASMVSVGASSFCGKATLSFTPRMCSMFAGGARRIFVTFRNRFNGRRSSGSSYRPSRPSFFRRNRALASPSASPKDTLYTTEKALMK